MQRTCSDHPGERLLACRDDALPRLRAHKREELLSATEVDLAQVQERVDAGNLHGANAIGLRVGRIINQYKVAKHFELTITDTTLAWACKLEEIAGEAAPDGLHIIRPSVDVAQMDGAACARKCKLLAQVETVPGSLLPAPCLQRCG